MFIPNKFIYRELLNIVCSGHEATSLHMSTRLCDISISPLRRQQKTYFPFLFAIHLGRNFPNKRIRSEQLFLPFPLLWNTWHRWISSSCITATNASDVAGYCILTIRIPVPLPTISDAVWYSNSRKVMISHIPRTDHGGTPHYLGWKRWSLVGMP